MIEIKIKKSKKKDFILKSIDSIGANTEPYECSRIHF